MQKYVNDLIDSSVELLRSLLKLFLLDEDQSKPNNPSDNEPSDYF